MPRGWLERLALRPRIESLADGLHATATGARGRWAHDDLFHAWWADDDRILAGEYPGSPDESTQHLKLSLLADAGIETIVDLTRPDDGLAPYEHHWNALGAARGRNHRRLHHPIRDVSVTTPEGYDAIVADLDRETASGSPVFVHCWGGVGRTGTVVGCWHVSRGSTADAAVDRIAAARAGTRKAGRPAPEVPSQMMAIHEAAQRWASP